jgi:hypothetical protein
MELLCAKNRKLLKEAPNYNQMGAENQGDQKRETVTGSSLTLATNGNEDIY